MSAPSRKSTSIEKGKSYRWREILDALNAEDAETPNPQQHKRLFHRWKRSCATTFIGPTRGLD